MKGEKEKMYRRKITHFQAKKNVWEKKRKFLGDTRLREHLQQRKEGIYRRKKRAFIVEKRERQNILFSKHNLSGKRI